MLRSLLKRAARALLPLERLRLADYVRAWVLPRNLPPSDVESTVPDHEFGHAGIELNLPDQLVRLAGWRRRASLFAELRADPRINTHQRGAIINGMYHSPDAEIYAAMILEQQPEAVVEIGSGFSTLIARRAITHGGLKTRLIAIDPEPRTEVANVADEVIRQPFEELALTALPVTPRTLLFIDSTHIARAGGDVPHLYCRVLPALPRDVLVHAHDIFLPYEYPVTYQRALWNEQYLLHALLADSPRYRVEFSTHWLTRRHLPEMQAVFGPEVGVDRGAFGSSFWFRVM